jgi:Carboxypeptidase regulatory-like domain
MRKLFLVVLIVAATFSAAPAQNTGLQNMGRAPKGVDGVGRVDARIVDAEGNPVRGAKVELKSKRTGGRLCEAWNWSNATGQAVLPPLHMGQQLKLTIQAPGFEKQTVALNASDLNEPVVIKLVRKS